MKLLPRFYEPEHGRILIDGYDISNYNYLQLDAKLALSHKIVSCSKVLLETI